MVINNPASGSGWTTFTNSSTQAADWFAIDGIGHPDFSEEGGLIEFGYRVTNTAACNTPSCSAGSTSGALDNYSVRIESIDLNGPPSDVPEPSGLLLAGGGLVLASLFRRRA